MITLAIDYRAAVPLSTFPPSLNITKWIKESKNDNRKVYVKYTSVKGVATGENQFLSCCTERR